jgi:hypothetical protein
LIEYGNYWSEVCGFEAIIGNDSLNLNKYINNRFDNYAKKIILNEKKNITNYIDSIYTKLQKKHWVNLFSNLFNLLLFIKFNICNF